MAVKEKRKISIKSGHIGRGAKPLSDAGPKPSGRWIVREQGTGRVTTVVKEKDGGGPDGRK